MCDLLCIWGKVVVFVCVDFFRHERKMGYLFVMDWDMVRHVALGSVVSVWCTLGGMVFVMLLWFLLLRYSFTIVVCICFMLVLNCFLPMVLVFVLTSVV